MAFNFLHRCINLIRAADIVGDEMMMRYFLGLAHEAFAETSRRKLRKARQTMNNELSLIREKFRESFRFVDSSEPIIEQTSSTRHVWNTNYFSSAEHLSFQLSEAIRQLILSRSSLVVIALKLPPFGEQRSATFIA